MGHYPGWNTFNRSGYRWHLDCAFNDDDDNEQTVSVKMMQLNPKCSVLTDTTTEASLMRLSSVIGPDAPPARPRPRCFNDCRAAAPATTIGQGSSQ